MNQCPNCQAELSLGANRCVQCGNFILIERKQSFKICPVCSRKNRMNSIRCLKCGNLLGNAQIEESILEANNAKDAVSDRTIKIEGMDWFFEGFKWYLDGLDKFFVFSGRSQRKAFWYFVLFSFLISLVLAVIDIVLAAAMGMSGLLSTFYWLLTLTPYLAVGCRRLHDINQSGLWLLLLPIPIVNMVLVMFWVTDGNSGENQYGPSPKITPPVFKKWW